ncbi:Protein of unknown function [Bacillus thuringiensis]|uniref:Uncharacterized protein n=1 Tax=Bacillus thuringiensis TaxID=1428 RepID=A0A1C4GGC3_BACTU|nr:Protein of unknown function [Bacillus thuringiensis]SCN11451.1 Protein of unknown function [Bacillus wiedmannii]
MKFFFGKGD